MKITFSIDPDDKQVLTVYVRLTDGKVKKTVELTDGACYVDVDSKGRPIGFEMLCPGKLAVSLRKLRKEYDLPGLDDAVKGVRDLLSA